MNESNSGKSIKKMWGVVEERCGRRTRKKDSEWQQEKNKKNTVKNRLHIQVFTYGHLDNQS